MKVQILLFALCFTNGLLALNPSRTYKQKPDRYNIKYTEVKVKTEDGASLNLWYFPTINPSEKLIIIAHNGDGNMADYLRRVNQFKTEGYNVVTFDYRGYGESSDFEINPDMYIYPQFTSDLISVMDYCRKNYQETYDLYGWGLGAGLVMGVGCNRTDVVRIIADTPFLSLSDLEEKFDQQVHWQEIPERGFDPRFEPITAAGNLSSKNIKGILILIGNNDPLFSPKDMETLRSQNRQLISVAIVKNPSRMDNFKANKEKYFAHISSFLDTTQ